MQFIAALVEHLVVGLFALLWILPLANQLSLNPDVKIADHKEVLIAVGLPTAYVVGVYVDVLASIITSSLRRLLDHYIPQWRTRFFGAHLPSVHGKSYERTVKILKSSPDEAARYLLQLSSREKVARGVWLRLNALTDNFKNQW